LAADVRLGWEDVGCTGAPGILAASQVDIVARSTVYSHKPEIETCR